ncbi:Serine/Threonine kinase domain protein (macronuclear) [Tetrahymena thermophila SB210]|uniref:Aurora kinase n=1 Tax=Tetrahymena thermophila (strain SB210) TaxID=312017 RepID=I7ME14_TETTS|nr:Serine/Threonine kinase domain protein [Tetrahymena thermophila SB210]EAR93838.1 Serine/Threonine kinase domain protein [Tetrahymena thermophila SB210]|eukprot:XP_001014083.1 Serine/Threonine kinase domain protein [Tetrahymena thermophila SB210]
MSQQQSYQLATSSKEDQSNQKLQEAPNNSSSNQDNSNKYLEKIIQQYKETTKSSSQTHTPSSFGNSQYTNTNISNISSLKTEEAALKNQLASIGDQGNTNQVDQKNNFSNLPPMIPKVSKPGEPSSLGQLGQNSQISIENINNLKNSATKLNQNVQNLTTVEPYEPYRKNAHQRQSSMIHLNGSSSSSQLQSLVAKGSDTTTNNQANSNSQQQQAGMKLSQTLGENSIKQLVANKIDAIKKQQDINSAANSQFKKEFINQFVATQSGHSNSTDILNKQSRLSFQGDLTPVIPYESYYTKQQMRNSKKLENTNESLKQQNKDIGSSITNNLLQQKSDQKEKKLLTQSQFDLQLQKYKQSLMNNLNLDTSKINESEKKQELSGSSALLADSVINLTESITGQNQSKQISSIQVPASKVQDSFSDRLLHFQYTSKNPAANNSAIESPDGSAKNSQQNQLKSHVPSGTLTAGATPTNNQNTHHSFKNSIFYNQSHQNENKASQFQQPQKQNPIDIYKYDFTSKNMQAAKNKILSEVSSEFSETNLQKIKERLVSEPSYETGKQQTDENKNNTSYQEKNIDYSYLDQMIPTNLRKNKYGQDKQRSNTIAINFPLPSKNEILQYEANQETIKFSFNAEKTSSNNQKNNEVPFNFAGKISLETNQQKQNLLEEKSSSKISSNQMDLNKWFYNQNFSNQFVLPTYNTNQQASNQNNTGNTTTVPQYTHFNSSSPMHSKIASNNFQNYTGTPQNISSQNSTQNNNQSNTSFSKDSAKTFSINIQNTIDNLPNNQAPLLKQDQPTKESGYFKDSFKSILSTLNNKQAASGSNTTTAAMASKNNAKPRETRQSQNEVQNRSFRSSSNNANSTSLREFNIQDFIKNEKINDISTKLPTQPTEDLNRKANKQEERQLNQSINSNRANSIINSVELFKRDLNLTTKLPSTQYLDEILGRNKSISNQGSSEAEYQQNQNLSKFSTISPLSKNQSVEFQIFTKLPEKREEKSNSISINSNIPMKQSNLISPRKLSFQAESLKIYYDKTDFKTQSQNFKSKNDINQNNIYQIKNELAFYQQSTEQFDKQNNQKPPLYDPNNINNKSKDNILNLAQQNSKNQIEKIQKSQQENNSQFDKNQDIKESFGILPQIASLHQSNKNSNNQSFSNMSVTSDQNQQQSISQLNQQANTSVNDYKSLGLINSFNSSVQNLQSKAEECSNNKDSSSQSSDSNIKAGDADNSSNQLQRKLNKAATSINYTQTALKSATQNQNILQNTPNYFTNPFSIDQTSTTSAQIFVSPKFEGADKDSTPVVTPAPFSNSVSTNSKNIQHNNETSKQVNPFDIIGLEDILKQKDLLEHNSKILQMAMTAFNINGEQILSDDGIISDEKIAKILQSNEKRSKQNEQMVKQNEELYEKIKKTLYGLENDQSTSQQKTLLLQERQSKKQYTETSNFSVLPQESQAIKQIQQSDSNKTFQQLLDAQKNVLPSSHANQKFDISNVNIQLPAPPAQTLSKGSPDKVGQHFKSENTSSTNKYHQSNSGNASPVNVNINDLLKPITPQPKERMLFTKDDVLQQKSNKKSSGKKPSSSHHFKPKKKEDQEKSAFSNISPNKSSEKGELGISQNSQKINSIFQNNGYSSSQSSSSQLQPNKSGNLDFTSNRAEGSFTSSSSSNTAHRESYGFSSSHSPVTTKRPLIFPENNTIESKFSQEQQQKSNLIVTQKVQYLKNQNSLNNNSFSEHKFANSLNTQEFHSSDTLNNLSAGNNISKILQNTNSEGQNAVVTVQVQVKQMPLPTKFMKKYKLPNPRNDHILFNNFFKKENFKIGKHLGTGKFSEVHMAQDLNTGLIVALKKIKKEVLIKYKSEDYLENEIKIQIFSNHPNILKLYGFYYDEEFVYLVQEYASHGELYQELKRQPNQRFDEIKGAAYMRQICDAFTYLHRYHIIHRDIKPENILMSFGVLKIADFGCSVYCPDDRRETFCGTIDYISPEIVNGEAYGQSVDIWSLGILTFELLTGKSPFQYETKNEILVNILNMNINIPNYLSEEAKDFIKSLLVRDPSKRMTMDQVVNHKWIVQNLQKYSQEWDADLAQKCKNMVI